LPAVVLWAAARSTPVPGYAAETTEVAFTRAGADGSVMANNGFLGWRSDDQRDGLPPTPA